MLDGGSPGSSSTYVEGASLWDLVEARAAVTPDALMLVDDRRKLTFAQYRDEAERAAAGFASLGIGREDTVAWQLPTWSETAVLMAALARVGVRQVPLLPIYKERELRFCLEQSGTSLLLVPGTWRGVDYVAMAERVGGPRRATRIEVCDRELPVGEAPLPPVGELPADASRWVFYTSGTTAEPKGVQHSDRSVMASGAALCAGHGIRASDRYGIAFPFTHVGGLVNVCASLTVGFALVLTETFDPEPSTRHFARSGVTIAGGGPAFYRAYLDLQRRNPGERILPELRFMTGGGAPMPPELHFAVRDELGGAGCAHGYGMTEVCIVALNHPHDTDEHLAHTVGRPGSAAHVRIASSAGDEAAAGVEGEITLRGPGLFSGYVDARLDADAFDEDGWFHTGDLGVLDPDGYLRVTGRIKDIIIRKGENVSAREVEDVLRSHPCVDDVAVIGLPDGERGERVCAVVVARAGQPPPNLADMVECCVAAGLMRQKIPEQLELVAALPMSEAGKVAKNELRARFNGRAPRESYGVQHVEAGCADLS